MGAKKVDRKASTQAPADTTNLELMLVNQFLKIKPFIIPIVIIVGVALSIVVGIAFLRHKKGIKNAEVYYKLHQALAEDSEANKANTNEDEKEKAKKERLEKLMMEFPTSPVVKDAKFYLAKVNFNLGKLNEAARQFVEFYEEYPEYEPFTTSARMAEANCLIAKRDFLEAKSKLQAISTDPQLISTNSGIVADATYKVALCDFLLGKFEETKTTLNSLLASSDNEFIKEKAQSFLAKMEIIPPSDMKEAIIPSKASSAAVDLADELIESIEQAVVNEEANTELEGSAKQGQPVDRVDQLEDIDPEDQLINTAEQVKTQEPMKDLKDTAKEVKETAHSIGTHATGEGSETKQGE